MSGLKARLTRRTLLLAFMTLAVFKRLTGMTSDEKNQTDEEMVATGGWLLKKSDLS